MQPRKELVLWGKRSAKARKEAWGEKEFLRRMREIGKLGGRPRKDGSQPLKEQQQ
ncbi:MAG: hypothetical protein ACR2JB_23355 [Bryobacteraceae bacterium]